MKPVLIVGAGLAGLNCARQLQRQGVECLVLEAQDGVGGRVRTDRHEGYLLDRGFQVLLDSYPEAQRCLDMSRLDLRPFEPGAVVRRGGSFHAVTDPFRRPASVLTGALSPIGTLGDKLRTASLRFDTVRTPGSQLLARPETSTVEDLRERGFSETMIDSFFRPFFGGVFLERSLETSSRWFELLFRLFSIGNATVPSGGMEAIPRQIARDLMTESVRTETRITALEESAVRTEEGERIVGAATVLAVEEPAAAQLLGTTPAHDWRAVDCLYFALDIPLFDRPSLSGPRLVLNGEGRGSINNLCVLSDAAPSYAPAGEHLLSVTALGATRPLAEVEAAVRSELVEWFGDRASRWRHLRSYRIPHAQPSQRPGELLQTRTTRANGIFVCGDYCETSSIHGALVSGRKTADAVRSALAG